MTSALQVVAMMASEIVKAHDITERQRDDALGTIRNSFRIRTSFTLTISYCLLVSGCSASSSTRGGECFYGSCSGREGEGGCFLGS